MRTTITNTGPGSIAVYKPADFALDLADIDAAIASGTDRRLAAARREHDTMLSCPLLDSDQRAAVRLRGPRVGASVASLSILL